MAEYIIPEKIQDIVVRGTEPDENVTTNLWLIKILGGTFADRLSKASAQKIPGKPKLMIFKRPLDISNNGEDYYKIAAKILCFIFDVVKTPPYKGDTKSVRLSWLYFEHDERAKQQFQILVDKIVEEYGSACLNISVWVERKLILKLIKDEDEIPNLVTTAN